MKHTIIFSAFTFILAAATFGSAQVSSMRVSFSESIDPSSGGGVGKVSFQDTHYNPNLRVFEAFLPVTTVEGCFATTDFSSARLVGPERATLVYDSSTSTYHLTWMLGKENRDTCRVLVIGETASTAGYNVWRTNFGRSSFAEDALTKDEVGLRTGDGSVRPISYQISGIYY